MGERKVLNKYIPADFDPKLVPRGKKSKDELIPVRMMLPFSIQCSSCSSFMYRGRKFNSKKEPVKGPEGKYLGIQRFRFYIKCTVCSRPVTFLTDPKNADYEMESGATRNYEVHKDRERTDEDVAAERAAEEKDDPMKALENRVLASQREMQEMDALEEIKALNMRHRQMMSGKVGGAGGAVSSAVGGGGAFDGSAAAILDAREAGSKAAAAAAEGEELTETGLTESEEAMVRSIKFGNNGENGNGSLPIDGGRDAAPIRRLDDDDEKEFEERRRREEALLEKQQRELASKAKAAEAKPLIPTIKVKRKRKQSPPEAEAPKKAKAATIDAKKATSSDDDGSDGGGGLGGLLGGYGSSASDSD